jgi:hypothetical protein
MGTAKRPKLATRYNGPRAAGRDVVSLEALLRVNEGERLAVAVLDLDAHGCRVSGFTAAVTKADRIELAFAGMAPVAARLRWAKRGGAGLKFDAPLGADQLAEAARCAVPAAPPRVIPLRRTVSAGET